MTGSATALDEYLRLRDDFQALFDDGDPAALLSAFAHAPVPVPVAAAERTEVDAA